MSRKQPHDVIVHNVGKEYQEEDEADLHEALFEGQAEVTATDPFHGKEQDITAIEDRNRQQVEDAEVHADQHHERNDRQRPPPNSFARGARNTHRALKLPDGDSPAEELSNDADRLLHAFAGHCQGVAHAIGERDAAVGSGITDDHSNLKDRLPGFRNALLGLHFGMNYLTFTLQFQFDGLALRIAHVLPKLAPVFNFLSIDSLDDVALLQASALCRSSRKHFIEDGEEWRIAKEALHRQVLGHWDFHAAFCPRVLDLHPEFVAHSSLLNGFLRLIPRGISDPVQGKEFVAGLERIRLSRNICREANDLHGLIEIGGIRQANGNEQADQKHNGEKEIDPWSCEGNQRALPARLAHQLVWSTGGRLIAGIDLRKVLPRHSHVTPEGKRADSPVRRAPFPAEEPRPEADGENIHADAEEARHDEVSPFVNHDHQPQHEGDA